MRDIKTEFLFTIALDVPVLTLGDTLPHHALLRDELGETCLDEPHLLDCYRLARGESAGLRRVSGVVGGYLVRGDE